MSETYVCARCGEEYEFAEDWTEEQARAEFAKNFPGIPYSRSALICDDCYQIILPTLRVN